MEKRHKWNGFYIAYDPEVVKLDKTNLVYKLTYPEIGKIYIGVVTGDSKSRYLKNRLNEHTQDAQAYKNGNAKNKIALCDKAFTECRCVKLEVLEECPNSIIAIEAEKRHIAAEAMHIIRYKRQCDVKKLSKRDKDIIYDHMFNKHHISYK